MPRIGATQLSFPSFRGATQRLVLANLAAFFALALLKATNGNAFQSLYDHATFWPQGFLRGWLWQPLTYSLVQVGILSTLLSLLSLWFLAGFLENFHSSSWVMALYIVSVLGTAAAALVIYGCSWTFGFSLQQIPLYGSFGGAFGLLAAIGILYGDTQFMLFPLPSESRLATSQSSMPWSRLQCRLENRSSMRSHNWEGRWLGSSTSEWRLDAGLHLRSVRNGMGCGIATTGGSADAQRGSLRSTCGRKDAP
jgi:membrane associated rhomboid family serine protease